MYCPECREPGNYPWQHGEDCRIGLKHQVRLLHWLLGICIVALAVSAGVWAWITAVLWGTPS